MNTTASPHRIGAALALAIAAAAAPPARPQGGDEAPARTAETVYAELDDSRRAGQLLMVWSLSKAEGQEAARRELTAKVAELGLGGVVLSLGEAGEARALVRELQSAAGVPLLIAGDFERGVAFRLEGATDLGSNMLIGATGLPQLAERAGAVTAAEARVLGFHWSFSPVVDVNSNPANPIINVRSFGEDPTFVARMAVAYIRGIEGAGMLACAKHFPGHGDVARDSHLEMPVVRGDRERLAAIELPPFRKAIEAGVSTIMTGHLGVPGLGEAEAVPATLSKRILTGVLREELGFEGLIVTDALGMGGLGGGAPGSNAVRALIAGADVLLMPPDPEQARDAILAALADGTLPRERFRDAVMRVLGAKERLGILGSDGPSPSPAWRRLLRNPQHRALAFDIARRGVTLVRDRLGRVPLPFPEEPADEEAAEPRVVLLSLYDADDVADDAGATFRESLEEGVPCDVTWHRLKPGTPAEEIEAAVADAREASHPVWALHVRVRSFSGSIGVPESLQPAVAALREMDHSVVVSFGNPYLVQQFPDVSTYVCAYNDGPHTERAVGDALTGMGPIIGRLPVGIPGIAERGDGLSWLPPQAPRRTKPFAQGFAGDLETRIHDLLAAAVEDGAFPGAVAAVARRGEIVAIEPVGAHTYDAGAERVAEDAVWDLASLTKVMATTPAVLRLIALGELTLDTPVAEVLPAFTGDGKAAVTVRHLLAHTSGLPSHLPLYRDLEGREAVVDAVLATDLVYEPGTRSVYSDLGMIVAMAVVEAASGAPFEEFVEAEVLEPLELGGARFGDAGEPIEGAVPTERCPWRETLVAGAVHDENAFAMGGVSGHAGLFGTAEDVVTLGIACVAGGQGWLPPALVREATRPAGLVDGSTRALGWDGFRKGGSGGDLLSPGSFGHTGFTGTSLWCDPRRDLVIALLTNRVHPTRDNRKIAAVRRQLADLVVEAIAEFEAH